MRSQTYIDYESSTSRSVGIPMPANHIHRTESELQFHSDMMAAESRDLQMFYRLIKGISLKQQHIRSKTFPDAHQQPSDAILRTEQSIMNIISTRHQNSFNCSSTLVSSSSSFSISHQDLPDTKSDGSTLDDWSFSGYESYSSTCNNFQDDQDDNWNDSDAVFDIDL